MGCLNRERIRRAFSVNYYSNNEFSRKTDEDAITAWALTGCAALLLIVGYGMAVAVIWLFSRSEITQ